MIGRKRKLRRTSENKTTKLPSSIGRDWRALKCGGEGLVRSPLTTQSLCVSPLESKVAAVRMHFSFQDKMGNEEEEGEGEGDTATCLLWDFYVDKRKQHRLVLQYCRSILSASNDPRDRFLLLGMSEQHG